MEEITLKLRKNLAGLPWQGKAVIAIGAAACIALSAVSVASAQAAHHGRGSGGHSAAAKYNSHGHQSRYSHGVRGVKAPVPVVVTPPVTTPPVATPPAPTPPVAAPPVVTPPVASPPATAPGSWPSAATTGVPAGTALSNSGDLMVTTPGAVITGLNINGDVNINAANVTIKNSKINGKVMVGGSNALLQRVEISGPGVSGAMDPAVGWSDYTCDGCNVHGWGKAFYMEDNVTIKNSWVHDLSVTGDPANGGSHNEAIFTQGGSNFTITGNRLDSGTAPNFSAAIALYGQQKAVQNALVQGNLMNGGGYCLYAGYDAGIKPVNVRFIGNTFGNSAYSQCGKFGAAVAYYPGNGNQWTGNVMQGGALVGLPGGL